MIYFDTDVWIHSLVIQDEAKHKHANDLIVSYAQKGYIISTLNLQEILFVLGKLKINQDQIKTIAEDLFQLNTIGYSLNEMKRAYAIAKQMSFKQINDCIVFIRPSQKITAKNSLRLIKRILAKSKN